MHKGRRGKLIYRGHPEKQDRKGQLDPLGRRVNKAKKATLDPRGRKDQQGKALVFHLGVWLVNIYIK